MEASAESKKGNEIRKKRKSNPLSVISSAIVIFFISAIAVALSYAYNGGYNDYYGIPMSLTTSSPTGIVMGTPQIWEIIIEIMMVVSSLAIIVKLCAIQIGSKKKKSNIRNPNIRCIVLCFCYFPTFVLAIFWAVQMKTIFMYLYVVFLVLYGILFFRWYKDKRAAYNKPYLRQESEFDSDIQENSSCENNQDTRSINANWGSGKQALYWIRSSIGISMFTMFFLLSYCYGIYRASEQEVYYFIGQDKIAISVFDSNIIAVSVNKNDSTGQYSCGKECYILPMDNIEMELKKTGTIKPNFHSNMTSPLL